MIWCCRVNSCWAFWYSLNGSSFYGCTNSLTKTHKDTIYKQLCVVCFKNKVSQALTHVKVGTRYITHLIINTCSCYVICTQLLRVIKSVHANNDHRITLPNAGFWHSRIFTLNFVNNEQYAKYCDLLYSHGISRNLRGINFTILLMFSLLYK